MNALTETSLSETERLAVERFVRETAAELGDELVAIWLYGSRARGEERRPESDVDLMVLTRPGADARERVIHLAGAAEAEHGYKLALSAKSGDTDWLRERREIRSFFVQEVDRDKIVLYGEAL